MKRKYLALVLLPLLVVCFLSVGYLPTVKGATTINSYPYTISSSGDYVIGTGGSTTTDYAITINADNVNLDGANIEISGNDANTCIFSGGHTGLNIFNMKIKDFSVGMQFQGSCVGVYVYDSTLTGCALYAIKINSISNSTIKNVNFVNNDIYAMLSQTSHDIKIDACTSTGAMYGFTSDTTNYNLLIVNCNTTTSSGCGYIAHDANYNLTYQNCRSVDDNKGFEIGNDIDQRLKLIIDCIVTNPTLYAVKIEATNVTIFRSNFTYTGSTWAINIAASSGSNLTAQQCIFDGGAFGVLDSNSGGNNTYKLNYVKNSSSNPYYIDGSTGNQVLHNAYTGNSSANSLAGTTLNDTALALTCSVVGDGSITPTSGVHNIDGSNWGQTFTATANAGSHLSSMKLNNVEVGITSPYYAEILFDQTMESTFEIDSTPIPTATPTPSPSPSPSPTPIVGDLTDVQWFAGALIFILVIFNIVLFMLPFALMRFVFAVVSLALCALAFAYSVPFSPYLQLLGIMVSVMSMYFASRARE